MTSSLIKGAARTRYLLDLLSQVPDPRKRRGRRHQLAGLPGVGVAAVIAGSRSFAAIGQWAADAGPDVLAALGADRGPADESTCRRAFALVSADILDQVLGAWLFTRAVRAAGRLVIAVDGKAVRGAKGKDGKAPHLVAALAHGIGAVLGQVAVNAKSNEIPAVRDLLAAFADLAGAPNMTKPGTALIAWYLNPDRHPVAQRWSRRHADTQRRLCQRFAAPVIATITCQDIATAHTQAIVNAAPTAGEGDRVQRMISALITAGIDAGYLTGSRLAKVHWQAGDRPVPDPAVSVAGESALWVDPAEIPSDGDIAKLGHSLAAARHGERHELMASTAACSGLR